MSKLHEVLAAEKTLVNARDKLAEDTSVKFKKADQYFTGMVKTLEMLDDSPEANAIALSARQEKELPTTVQATMDYFLDFWAKAENLLHQKNVTNTTALADLVFRGAIIAHKVPVDELMGLEARLGELRKLVLEMPTLDASRDWAIDPHASQPGTWKATKDQVTSKTEKEEFPVVLAPATDKHPAQVKLGSKDKVVGTFKLQTTSGATTAIQKANLISTIDELLIEVKTARTRANAVDVATVAPIGKVIKGILMDTLKDAPTNNQV
jgi:hypothetical protein